MFLISCIIMLVVQGVLVTGPWWWWWSFRYFQIVAGYYVPQNKRKRSIDIYCIQNHSSSPLLVLVSWSCFRKSPSSSKSKFFKNIFALTYSNRFKVELLLSTSRNQDIDGSTTRKTILKIGFWGLVLQHLWGINCWSENDENTIKVFRIRHHLPLIFIQGLGAFW